ncbi:MAG TPA: UbiA prenyltransferase family protein [Chitinophagaceae bacterium]|nr:UbiA prenyltransferase family protein [Chitinophagaceae bacterium]
MTSKLISGKNDLNFISEIPQQSKTTKKIHFHYTETHTSNQSNGNFAIFTGYSLLVLSYFKLLRPKDWAKNLFLFIPLFFSGNLFNWIKLEKLAWGFLAFSLIASSVYILNDYRDIEVDRNHPVKCSRPLASGSVSKTVALGIMSVCIIAGFALSLVLRTKFTFVLGIYFLLNVAYSFGLKNISILDILILAIGFVLRVKAGGILAFVVISQWLIIMVFLLALFMAVGKRRDDVLIRMKSGKDMRQSVKGYNLDFLNVCLAIVCAIIIMAYLMYTVSPEVNARFGSYRLFYTALFVISGIMRYLQLIYLENNSGSPTKLLFGDRFLQINLLLWIISFYVILYMPSITLFNQ